MRIMALAICTALGGALTGCADATKVPVQPVTITGSDFCQIQSGKLSWDIKDTRATINGINRFNAKWDARCGKSDKPTS